MLKSNQVQLILILFIILLFVFYKLDYKDQNYLILATVGERQITAEQFIRSYSFGSSKLKPKNNTKQRKQQKKRRL